MSVLLDGRHIPQQAGLIFIESNTSYCYHRVRPHQFWHQTQRITRKPVLIVMGSPETILALVIHIALKASCVYLGTHYYGAADENASENENKSKNNDAIYIDTERTIESANSNRSETPNDEGDRLASIQSRLVFQEVIFLPSKEKGKPSLQQNKPSQKGRKRNVRNDGDDDGDNDDADSTIDNRENRQDASSSIRSLLTSIRLLVYFRDQGVSVQANKHEKMASKAALKDQSSCSICLEDYSVGDIVVRLKSNVAGDTRACNHCFHEGCILEWLKDHDECPLCRIDMMNSGV
eukprot:CAMPEP_0172402252 /NCGR_PEP_ID=MMETSP1061-20121228/53824_1 /TAXON_ID=37318 /ORGANISM="Pseudo-nitzschia pungens, Strain cf. pungens" /LENGTH=291 /DNA_ID=CAMNT_0013136171 /DNA_START=154 /DNA_END=1029 /DNA_ORIENTATION=-